MGRVRRNGNLAVVRPSVKDVARLVGMSETTVFRALRDDPKVKPQTIARVKKAAEQIRYRPSLVARTMCTRRSYTIGVMLPRLEGFFSQTLVGISDCANQNGYQVIIYSLENSPLEKEREFTHQLIERMVDGVIIAPKLFPKGQRSHLEELQERSIPFVIIDRELEDFEANFITCDDRKGAMAAVEHLIGLGHRRIAHIAGPQQYSTSRNRLQGYRDALERHQIPFDPRYLHVVNGFDQDLMASEGYAITKRLMQLDLPPTGIFCIADMAVPGVYRALEEHQIKVPDQVSVMGYTDFDYAKLLHIPLTTVRQPSYQLGYTAMKVLLEVIADPGKKHMQTIYLRTELVVRESTGPCRDTGASTQTRQEVLARSRYE
ncbi:MAG TPA: LacI family DNA-binding transcriptional regulator [Candidatus Hydrogenedentes bacterium]|nr:LacI family DNA-binding transcriptional regulator [Candidatus Hydrogenedentota bacterium]